MYFLRSIISQNIFFRLYKIYKIMKFAMKYLSMSEGSNAHNLRRYVNINWIRMKVC
jgi:hypothetical protein